MAKITISELQGHLCVEALELSARFAAKNGEEKLSRDLEDLASRIQHKLQYVDDKMRSDGRRK